MENNTTAHTNHFSDAADRFHCSACDCSSNYPLVVELRTGICHRCSDDRAAARDGFRRFATYEGVD